MPKFRSDFEWALIADASVLINLHATGMDDVLLDAIKHPFVTSENARVELLRGVKNGHGDSARLANLEHRGLIGIRALSAEAEITYESLVLGSGSETLDDGEAATLAIALHSRGIALIDEQKAYRIAAAKFPSLEVISTADILLHPFCRQALGMAGQKQAVYLALTKARMRVPTHLLDQMCSMFSPQELCECPSLPRHVRQRVESNSGSAT